MGRNRFTTLEDWLEEDNLIRIRGWSRKGLTMAEIAEKMGITRKTLYEWAEKESDISDALKETKDVVDNMVEAALFRSTQGYYVDEKKTVIAPDGSETVTVTQRYIPPSPEAQKFWSRNRQPSDWKANPEEVKVTVQIDTDVESMILSEKDKWKNES